MRQTEFFAKWERQAAEFEVFDAQVSGGALCRAVLKDLELVRAAEDDRALSLTEAAQHSGYSKAHLARLVQDGKLTTLRPPGSRGRLSFRQADLPRKPGSRHRSSAGVHELASRLLRGKERHHGRS